MLETLRTWPDAGRRIVVAGEMLELGPQSAELHAATGRQCAASDVSWLIAVQGEAQFFLEGALKAGFPLQQARFFAARRRVSSAALLGPAMYSGEIPWGPTGRCEVLRSRRGRCGVHLEIGGPKVGP